MQIPAFLIRLTLVIGAACLSSRAWAYPENRAAWKLLLDNKPQEARAEFLKNIKGKDAVAGEAYRGLGVIARFMGDHFTESELAFESFLKDKDTAAMMAGAVRRMHFSRQWEGHKIKKGYKVSRMIEDHPSLLTASAVSELALRLAMDGETGDAKELEDGMGLVRKWWAIGPFSNISGSGFDKAYPPEAGVELGKHYDGKNGNRVRWFPISLEAPASWIFSQNHFVAENAILYFATQLESPQERMVTLGFGASGSFKVFVNDKLVLAERMFRNTGENAFTQEVTLRKGNNRILIKLGSEERYSNFQLHVYDASGRGVTDLKVSKPEGSYQKDPGQAAKLDRSVNEERTIAYLKARLKADPDDEDAALLLTDSYNVNEKTDSGEVWALARLERNPKSALWQSLLAEALVRSRQITRSQEYLKAAYKNCPYSFIAWQHELSRLAESAGAQATLEFIAKGPKEFSETQEGLMMRFAKAAEQGRKAEAMELVGRFEKLDQFNLVTAAFLSAVYKNQGKQADAVKIWKKLLDHDQINFEGW